MQESEITLPVGTQFGERQTERAERASLTGELTFMSPEAQEQRTAELLGDGAILVAIDAVPGSMRGRLAEYIDERIERALGVKGAPSPYMTAWSAMPEDAEERIADQIFRARSVGATGIAVALGSMGRIAAPALTPEDSVTLSMLAKVTQRAALVVLVDDADEWVGAYGEPIPLRRLVLGSALPVAVAVPVPDLVDEHVHEYEDAHEEIAHAHAHAHVDVDEHVHEHVDEHPDEYVEMRVEAVVEVETAVEMPAEVEVQVETKVDAPVQAVEEAPRRVAVPPEVWRSWAIALAAARGPQALAVFEKLFVESYMPLTRAIEDGLEDARALRAHDEFRRGFERSYTDAFATFGATGRRPRLVMDAFDFATKQARLHNARTSQLLLVDGMRHDLGCVVRDEIAARAPASASLTSESLLWSALPTTTYRQLETLARGMEALRAPSPEDGSESLRGRTAETVRRMRVGSRELYKLDLVPAMLGALHLDDIAVGVADALLRHMETLPPRTLLLVIGDHGFSIDRRGHMTDGGASPEEVLVPCLSYLIAELH